MFNQTLFKCLVPYLFLCFPACDGPRPQLDPKVTSIAKPIPGVLPYFKGEHLDPYWKKKNDTFQDLKILPPKKLLSHENQWIDISGKEGKNKLIVFFFAKCHGICPRITANLVKFLPELEPTKGLSIFSITIDPERDSVDQLIVYRKLYKITNPNWIFFTGKKEEIYKIARDVFSADVKLIQGNYDLQDFVHTENIFLLDKQNYLRGVYRAKGTGDLERLKQDWKILNSEI